MSGTALVLVSGLHAYDGIEHIFISLLVRMDTPLAPWSIVTSACSAASRHHMSCHLTRFLSQVSYLLEPSRHIPACRVLLRFNVYCMRCCCLPHKTYACIGYGNMVSDMSGR